MSSAEVISDLFDVAVPPLAARYNVAPTQEVLAVRERGHAREAALLRWGLIPPWAKDARDGARFINARAETVFEKSLFREPLKKRRCVVIFDGFYEWRREGRTKTPYYIRVAGGGPFAVAGLWSSWTQPGGAVVESCTVLTTSANELVARLHDRMPALLHLDEVAAWLDDEVEEPDLGPVLRPFPAGEMEMWQVSPKVNRWQNDEPACIAPITSA